MSSVGDRLCRFRRWALILDRHTSTAATLQDRPGSLQEIEFGVKQIVKVCFMDLMYNIDLEGEHIKSCNMQQFYFFPNGQKYAIMI